MSSPESPETALKPCFVVLEPITPKVNVNFSADLKKAINERNLLTSKTRKRVSEALEEIHCESEESSRKTKKAHLLSEILESEENYVRQLEVITEFFMKPIQQRNLLKPRDFVVLFGNIRIICDINKELLAELRKGPGNVAQAFSNVAPYFKCYSFYAFEFKKSLTVLQNCHRDNPKFAKFLEMQESRPEVQSKLSALLIAPIQRVPRYKLLLEPLFRLTAPRERDYQSLLDSLTKVENAADRINEILEERENMQRLIELQRCFQNGKPNVITPGRSLLKEGALARIAPKGGPGVKMHVVLTNDIIIFCKMKNGLRVNSLKCSGIYPLIKCKIQELLDKGAFRITCQNEEIVLFHESYSETLKWIDEIKAAIQTTTDDRKTLRKESTIKRPVKRKDLGEYNEVGVSPGKKLKKRKIHFEHDTDFHKPTLVATRRAIRPNLQLPDYHDRPTPSFFVTLKPQQDNHENEVAKDVFVFGQPNPDRGFKFKMNQLLCGIGTSIKNFFGFKN